MVKKRKKREKLYLVSVQYYEDDEFEIEAYSKKEARKKAEAEINGPYANIEIEEIKEREL